MMSPLAMLKANLRVDGDTEDSHLQALLEVAEERVIAETRRSREELMLEDGTYPAPLMHAIILLAGHFYDEPGIITTGSREMPYSYTYLISPYRKLS